MKEDPCYYVGHPDDIRIESEFVSMNPEGKPVMKLYLVYDKIDTSTAEYKWEINGQVSETSTMIVTDDGPASGYIKIRNSEDQCFLYKEVDEVFDFSDCCEYMGDEDYVTIRELKDCSGGDNKLILEAEYKGPSNMGLTYRWDIEGQTSDEVFIVLEGDGIMDGTLRVMNPEDSCTMVIPVVANLLFGSIIGNRVWIDNPSSIGQSHILDSTDTQAEGISVDLLTYPEMELVETTVTDDEGYYLFLNAASREYVLQFHAPSQYEFVLKNYSQDDTEDSDANFDGLTDPFFLDNCEQIITLDAGLKLK